MTFSHRSCVARRIPLPVATVTTKATATIAALLSLAVIEGSAPRPARGEACKLDSPPAATLLLPYFELDLAHPGGITTMFSVGNATDRATLAHVTLWTDLGVPTMDFNVYLTGWDIETFNLRDLFEGRLPQNASDGQDPTDQISPQGPFSQDINFASCTGMLPLPPLPQPFKDHLRASHTGGSSPILGGCSARAFGDGIARGYVTIDVVRECTLRFPSDPGYFGPGGSALSDNVLFGDFFYVESSENSARGEELVRIEAFPGRFRAGDVTFYGRFHHGLPSNYQAVDDREPLAPTWATRYIKGGTFDAGTSILVWRDPGEASKVVPCGTPQNWQTIDRWVAFDEEESVSATQVCPFLCPPTLVGTSFPAVAQRVDVNNVAPSGGSLQAIPFDFGWLEVQFFRASNGAPPTQAWLGVEMKASQRFSIGSVGMPLDSSCGPPSLVPGF
jgi:hypothetical protein